MCKSAAVILQSWWSPLMAEQKEGRELGSDGSSEQLNQCQQLSTSGTWEQIPEGVFPYLKSDLFQFIPWLSTVIALSKTLVHLSLHWLESQNTAGLNLTMQLLCVCIWAAECGWGISHNGVDWFHFNFCDPDFKMALYSAQKCYHFSVSKITFLFFEMGLLNFVVSSQICNSPFSPYFHLVISLHTH
jgi:hypothetical protein